VHVKQIYFKEDLIKMCLQGNHFDNGRQIRRSFRFRSCTTCGCTEQWDGPQMLVVKKLPDVNWSLLWPSSIWEWLKTCL
jgi:hypothetical protein